MSSIELLTIFSCLFVKLSAIIIFSEDTFFLGVNDKDGSGNSEGWGATTKLRLEEKKGEVRGFKGLAAAVNKFFVGDSKLLSLDVMWFQERGKVNGGTY